ncbi:Hypothetical protein, putative [Bodo saltans]|uniref:EF-hand domain-containing protein n=1 Tax=Bodo saltans TaxID=75058 RepID=A0A0S4IN53_BODSA|nr:Hypothetical protein, putative [Bodo saltans]|eukprot:CUE77946.1 Hypothetical protein, putative [Bodo saltans]
MRFSDVLFTQAEEMIEISTISARKLPIPHGCEFHFIVTASIGEACVSSAPVKPVLDHRLGSSLTFREQLSLPCNVDGTTIDVRAFGIHLCIRSVCGTMSLGSCICRVSKQWVPVIPVGEAMVSFSVGESLAIVTQPLGSSLEGAKRSRPSTAGPAVRSSATDDPSRRPTTGTLEEMSVVSATSEYSGSLTIGLKSIKGLAISTSTPVSLYVQAQFAMDEGKSSPLEVNPASDGHRGTWPPGSNISFDVLPSNTSRLMTLSVFGAWVRSGQDRPSSAVATGAGTGPHHLIGVCKVDVPTNLGGENQHVLSTLVLSGHPRSQVEVEITLTYLKPRKEGASGRPLSAYPRRAPGASGSGDFTTSARGNLSNSGRQRPQTITADEDDDVLMETSPQKIEGSLNGSTPTQSKVRAKLNAGRRAWGEESQGGTASFETVLLARLEDSIASAVSAATNSVLERLGQLEARVQRSEELLSQLRPPTGAQRPGSGYSAGPRIPKAPSSMSGAASRPSSADSVGGYDVSHSIVTDSQLRTKFHEYDTKHRGLITVPQLIHFYRANSPFGDDEDEARILKYFDYCGIRVRSSEGVSFDDFARLALRLAQR